MNPYYQDDAVTIYHGDCLDVLPQLPPVDLIFTSPPYNLGTTSGGGFGSGSNWARAALANGYDTHGDDMPHDKYMEWQREVVVACWSRLSDSGALFYNHKPRIQRGHLWTPLEVVAPLPVRQIVIWKRAGGMNFSPTHFVPTHEWIVVVAKPGWALKDRSASGVGDVWDVVQESGSDHPAPFPLGLPLRAINATTAPVVLDPFMGSGTTLRAAKDLGRKAIGIDVSERYCEMAAKRMAQEVLPL